MGSECRRRARGGRTVAGAGYTYARPPGCGCPTERATSVTRQFPGGFTFVSVRARVRPTARPPSSNDIDGLLCFHPTTTSSPLFLRRRPTSSLQTTIRFVRRPVFMVQGIVHARNSYCLHLGKIKNDLPTSEILSRVVAHRTTGYEFHLRLTALPLCRRRHAAKAMLRNDPSTEQNGRRTELLTANFFA